MRTANLVEVNLNTTKTIAQCTRSEYRHLDLLANLLAFFLCVNIGIDFVAGLTGFGALSQVVRVIFFLILLYIELLLDRLGFCVLIIWLAYLLTISFISQTASGDLSLTSYLYDINTGIKFTLSFCVYRSIVVLKKCGLFDIARLDKVFSVIAIYVPLLYLGSSLLGIGSSSYSSGSGFKSVFLSLNSINISIIVLFTYSLNKIFECNNMKWIVIAALNGVSLLLLSTKASFVFIAVIFIYYLFASKKNRMRNIFFTIVSVAIIAVIFVTVPYLQNSLTMFGSRQSYLFENRSLIDFITSGRTWMLEDAVSIFNSTGNPVTFLFGNGYYVFHHALAVYSDYLATNVVRPIEFDWADLFFSFGLVVTLIVYGFLFSKIYKGALRASRCRFYFISLVVMVLYGAIGGHVLFEAMPSTILGSIIAGIEVCKVE